MEHPFDAIDRSVEALEDRAFEVLLGCRFTSLEGQMTREFDVLQAEMRGGFADMQRRTIQWSVGTMIAMTTVLTAAFGVFSQLN